MQKLFFFNLFVFNNNKGTVSIISFTLVLLVLLLLLSFTFIYVENSKDNLEISKKSLEIVNSFSVFRDSVIKTIPYNSTVEYVNTMDSLDLTYYTSQNSYIVNVTGETESELVWVNMSTLGLRFCGSYNFSPTNAHNFSFNGSCISMG